MFVLNTTFELSSQPAIVPRFPGLEPTRLHTCMQHYRNKNSPGNGAGSRATPDHLLRWDRQGQPGTGVSTPVIRKVTHGVGSDCSNLRLRGGVRSRWWGRTPLAFHSARERRRDHAFSRICTCHRDTRHITSLKTLSAVITLATAECRRRKCSYHEFATGTYKDAVRIPHINDTISPSF